MVHRARFTGRQRSGARDGQGAYPSVVVTGPWIPARLMERGGVASKSRRGQATVAAVVERGYELILDSEDENGQEYPRPTASALFETDCPILGSPLVVVTGEPEVLNNGDDLIGYLLTADVAKDRS
jgi:hypothetical protein